MRRIVRETLKDGSVQYVVERRTWLLRRWVTDTFPLGEHEIEIDAIFDTRRDAELFAFGNPVVCREVLPHKTPHTFQSLSCAIDKMSDELMLAHEKEDWQSVAHIALDVMPRLSNELKQR